MVSSNRLSTGGLLFSSVALAAAIALSNTLSVDAFAPAASHCSLTAANGSRSCSSSTITTSTTLYNRADRRKDKKKKKKRSLIDDEEETASSSPQSANSNEPILLGGGEIGATNEVGDSKIPVATATSKDQPPKKSKLDQELSGERIQEDGVVGESVTSAASVSDMPIDFGQALPDVSTIVTDPDTGIARIQQGKYVMDKVTGKAVVLSSLGPEYRLAQMLPGVSPEIREKYRFDWTSVTIPEMIEQLKAASTVPLKNSSTGKEWLGIPPHPQISNPAVDFVLSNRDYLGHRMKKALGRLKLRAQSQFQKEEALELRALWKHFLLLEDHISAPFRQIMLNAESNVGPNFGNLDVKSYCGGTLYERTANYLVLKSMVAHWEKKYNDALELDKIPDDEGMNFMAQLYTGDPKRYLPDPPIIFRLAEVSRIVVMAQNMCKAFVDEPELFDDLPAEVKFVEKALGIQGGTALRQFMLEDFCPANNVDAASLREGIKRVYQQMFNMQTDPYSDLTMTLWNLCVATSVGTDEARDPYEEYIANVRNTKYENNPGFFQTYTFNHDKNSLVRFLDSAKLIEKGTAGSPEELGRQIQGEAFQLLGFNFGADKDPTDGVKETKKVEKDYEVPEDRAIGRPHMMGWLDLLGDDEEAGITGDDKEESFEADKWEEVKA
eukprot:CAMPEP_0201865888 /NCGR_PEP_ID=MMETSP0902-20130614/662_1 /ASSEMBLY_ACC=CAM_ASM_000551 /TAXON_ID=420261 /ORGANISM="Thalassiosira antarctica, Strain CCMP982" /LENGTH=665 /DNA_ID=CAMNT_0048390753 /DNA_START=10 /DNA_END=2007 /DNA_ORIENTATION=-